MSVELLEPWADEHNDFLARFVARARRGPAPPHVQGARPRGRARPVRALAGSDPVNIDLSDPEWKEAFLLPARGARHRRAARRDARELSAPAPSCSRTSRRTGRTCTRAGGSTPNRTRGRPRSCGGSCCGHRPLFGVGLLRRRVAGRGDGETPPRAPISCGRRMRGFASRSTSTRARCRPARGRGPRRAGGARRHPVRTRALMRQLTATRARATRCATTSCTA